VRVKGAWKYSYRAVDKSGVNTAAILSYNADHDTDVEIRQVEYLNNIVEQDHRAIKRMVGAMLGFKAFWSTAITITGIEIMHMIPKDQLRSTGNFYSLAA
jgi:putative transposase